MTAEAIQVLFIEDDSDYVQLLRESLARVGEGRFRLISADRLASGLARLAKGGIDLVLLDLSLPDSQGLDTVNGVLAEAPQSAIVILTGYEDRELALKALEEGVQDYLVKGNFKVSWLADVIREVVSRKRLQVAPKRQSQALQTSQRGLRKIIEFSADGMVVVDGEGKVRFVNPAAEALFQRRAEQMIGEPFSYSLSAGEMRQIDIVRKDGIILPAEMGVAKITWEGEKAYLASLRRAALPGAPIIQPYSVERRAEPAGRLQLSAGISPKLQGELDTISRRIAEVIGETCLIYLLRGDGRSLELVAYYDPDLQASAAVREAFAGEVLSTEEQLIEQTIGSGQPCLVPRVESEWLQKSGGGAYRSLLERVGARCLMLVPLWLHQRVVGLLHLSRRSGALQAYAQDDLLLGQDLAEWVSLAIANSRLASDAHKRLGRLKTLISLDQAIGTRFGLTQTLDLLVMQMRDQLGVDAVAILLVNRETLTLEFAAGYGFRTGSIEGSRLRLGEGFAGRVAQEGTSLYSPDLAREPGFLRTELLEEEGFVSYYGMPLIANREPGGVLEIFHGGQLRPDQEWLDFLHALATQTTIAMDYALLFESLQEKNRELNQAYDFTLEGWLRALNLRDEATTRHAKRVIEMTERVALEMGVPKSQLVHLRRGALLHDIGKMAIPDSILNKPGPLTQEEWEIMYKHPVYAYELLSPIDYLRPAIDIPYCHHEKWVGTGYPRGLRGEEIPLAARIFAVVDVWDALQSKRPYREAWPAEKSVEYIRTEAGKHFDPRVVEVFLKLLEGGEPE